MTTSGRPVGPGPSAPPPARITLAGVAARANVSVGTASKALSGTGRMRDETRARVLEAASALGFRPHRRAQGPTSDRSWIVGLITEDGVGRFSTPVLLGAEDALGAGRISVLLCDTRGDAIREQHHLRVLVERRVDGIIVTGRRPDPRPPIHGVGSIPIVYAFSSSSHPRDASVVCDARGGAELAIDHLRSVGRTRIAHVTGPAHHAAARDRAERALELLRSAGLTPATGRPHFGEWSEAWGRRAAESVLRAAPDTDAFFCGNDQIARGVAETLRERGVRIPDDIAVVGYDNWDVIALAARPPLTTVDMNLGEVGRIAALRLLKAIDTGTTQPGIVTVPSRLIVRESA